MSQISQEKCSLFIWKEKSVGVYKYELILQVFVMKKEKSSFLEDFFIAHII